MSNLSDEQKDKIQSLYRDKWSIREIARSVKKDYKVVSNFLEPFKENRGPRSLLRNLEVLHEQQDDEEEVNYIKL